jgi:hypothetical protein
VSETREGAVAPVVPFIDIGKFDPETKDWYWMDASGFPYRIFWDNTRDEWYLNAQWPINHIGDDLYFDPETLNYQETGRELGFYSTATTGNASEFFMYSARPIQITIEGKRLRDTTIYGSENITTGLTQLNTELNPEFYYDSTVNKIYTNQNLIGVDPVNIKVYFYDSADSVSVKCRMSANSGGDAYYTPIVDYYVVKLNGQFLRG